MNVFSRILTLFGARARITDRDVDAALQQSLESRRRALSTADPDTARQWQRLARTLDAPAQSARPVPRAFRVRPAMVGVSLASLAVAAVAVYLLRPEPPGAVSYRTSRGENTSVVLADSSQILLNHTTELSVVRAGEGRLVMLQGEALFRVRRTGEPFLVMTDAGTVRVLGTEFNVRVRGGMLEVAVLSGRVQVTAGAEGTGPSVVLAPGEITRLHQGGVPSPPERLLFPDYPGWTSGKLMLQHSTVALACAEIESRFGVAVTIENPRLNRETLTGILDARSPGAAVATIARLTGSQFRHEKNAYILY